ATSRQVVLESILTASPNHIYLEDEQTGERIFQNRALNEVFAQEAEHSGRRSSELAAALARVRGDLERSNDGTVRDIIHIADRGDRTRVWSARMVHRAVGSSVWSRRSRSSSGPSSTHRPRSR